MAALPTGLPTLLDVAKREDPDGKLAKIAEKLDQKNEMLMDMGWQECNNKGAHQVTVRVGLPVSSYRQINAGSQISKSLTAQFVETCGIMDEYSEVDVKLAKLYKDPGTFLVSEAAPKIEAMNQKVQRTILYGNGGVTKEEFDGFMPRYSSTTAANGQQIVLGGGSTPGQNASILIVVWGEDACFGLYPEGSKAGLGHEHKGQITVENANGVAGARMEAFRDHFTWDNGLCVRDWEYVARIPNIDIPALVANTSPCDIELKMTMAIERIKDENSGRIAIYCNRTVREMWGVQQRAAVGAGGGLTYENVAGKRVTMWRGIPVRRVDQMLSTEGVVS